MKAHLNITCLLLAAGALRAVPAGAATVVVLPASQDAMIFATSAGVDSGNASGAGPALFAGADGSGNKKRSLLAFDIASANIPRYATIQSVTMTLYLAQVAGSGGGSGGGRSYPDRTLRLYALQQAWTEGASGSPTTAGVGGPGQGYPRTRNDVTWDYASYQPGPGTPIAWSNGTTLHGGNFAATESATPTFTDFTVLNAPFTWSSAGMTADVQGWLDGTRANDGWLLKSDLETSPTSFLGFWTREGATANNDAAIAPSLSITYDVPEPAGLLLIACALATLAARPRHRARHEREITR